MTRIHGHRGSPLEAPENTLLSLMRALELGLDGVHYEVQACATGELWVTGSELLDPTTNAAGPIADRGFLELSELDAGGWFQARFRGEPLALLGQVLELVRHVDRPADFAHVVRLEDPRSLGSFLDAVRDVQGAKWVRLASSSRELCLEAQSEGLGCVWLLARLDEDARRFARDARLTACCAPPNEWNSPLGRENWGCERWAHVVNDPEDLLAACRGALFGCDTHEPLRALSLRRFAQAFPEGDYPLRVPNLPVEPSGLLDARAEWAGSWTVQAEVRNPFAHDVALTAGLVVRRGAFEVEGLPVSRRLAPQEEIELVFRLTGGSWSPGGDPVFFATFRMDAAEPMTLEAPLHRVRVTAADALTRRITMLREAPEQEEASMTLRRHRGNLLVSLENVGQMSDAHSFVHLEGHTYRGGRGLRVPLPADFDRRQGGIAFSCGFEGTVEDEHGARHAFRRFSGGVPHGVGSGAPGLLLPLPGA